MKYRFKKGYKKSEEYHINKCGTIYADNAIDTENRYLILDDSIYSGGILASFHLEKDGYFVIGPTPDGMCKSFGNNVSYNLPNSKLYINISTLRLKVDENIDNRDKDKIIPDMELSDYSMAELLVIMKEKERKAYSNN